MMNKKADGIEERSNKVSLLLPTLFVGGAEKVSLNLAGEFHRMGYDVDLVLSEKKGELLSEVPKGVNVVNLDEWTPLFSGVVPSTPALAYYLRKIRPDTVISALTHSNLSIILASRIAGYPDNLIITEHLHTSSPSRKQEVAFELAKFLYTEADEIVAVSKGVAEGVSSKCDIGIGQIKTITNPVVSPDIHRKKKEPIEHRWFDREVPVITSLGRLADQKDYPTLLHSFKKLLSKRDARLVVIGTGELREDLEDYSEQLEIDNKVEFTGFVDNPYKYLYNSDAFVMSSKKEGLPTVLIEALACGCPIISTDCPSGPREILQNGKYGRLVPVGDSMALAESVDDVLSDPPSAERQFTRAEDYSVSVAAKRYQDLFK